MSFNQTPLLGLRYPNTDAAPCDFDTDWCVFAADVQAYFDRWQAALYRAYPAVPAALMQMTAQRDMSEEQLILFDASFDTANMVDMDADPYSIYIRRSGRYTVGAYIGFPHASSGDDQVTLWVLDNGAGGGAIVTSDQLTDLSVISFAFNNAETQVVNLVEGSKLQLGFFQSGAPTRQIQDAWMCAFWHSDSEGL